MVRKGACLALHGRAALLSHHVHLGAWLLVPPAPLPSAMCLPSAEPPLHVWRAAGQQAEDGAAVRGEPEFIGAAGTGAQDTGAAYATRRDAQRLLNQKHMHEIEAALGEALRKAEALWSEMQEEQRLNGSLRQLVVKLRTSKLEVEDRIEE